MKQLKVFTGGHPISGDDLLHLSESTSETLAMLCRGLVANGASIPNCRLYGCNITTYGNGDVDISAGAVILNGEICEVAYQLIPDGTIVNPLIAVFSFLDTYKPNNPVTYGDGTTKNVHLIRKANVVTITGTPSASQMELFNAPMFIEILRANMLGVTGAWVYPGDAGQPAYLNGFTQGYPGSVKERLLRFRKTAGNVVHLSGEVDFEPIGSLASLNTPTMVAPFNIFQLPVGMRPDNGGASGEVFIETPDGECRLKVWVFPSGNVAVVDVFSIDPGVSVTSFSSLVIVGRIDIQYIAL